MKTSLSVISILIIPFVLIFSFAKKDSHWYQSSDYSCKYQTLDGRFHGKYTSYYSNGKKKAEGVFQNNYRCGIWTIWDENGSKLIQRDYSGPFSFKQIFPASKQNNNFSFELIRDSFGCYKHHPIKDEKLVLTAYRLHRKVETKLNPILFGPGGLFPTLNNLVQKDIIPVYTDHDLVQKKVKSQYDESQFELVGFKTMEDNYTDKERLASEFYTIAVCPVVRNRTNGDILDLYWVNMEDLRKHLAKVKTASVSNMPRIENLDDIFHFHCFYGEVIKSYSFLSDKSLASNDPFNKSLRVDLDLINNEHDVWIYQSYTSSQNR
jgi:hypothetical protein